MVKTVIPSRAVAVLALAVSLALAGPTGAEGPVDGEATFSAGVTHLREGRTQQALEAFKTAVKSDPKNAYFHKGLGQAYLALGKPSDAAGAFRKCLQINPYYVDARNDLGTALVLSGKREDGRKEFLAAYNDPTNPTPEITARNLGQAYFDDKNYAEALNWFRTSASRNKAYPDAHIRLADTLVVLGRIDEAVAQLEQGAAALPDELGLILALGEAYYRAGRFADARVRLEQVASKDPVGASGRRAAELLKNFPK